MTRIREGGRGGTPSRVRVVWADKLKIIPPPVSAGRNCEHRTVSRVMFLSMVTAPHRRRDISSMTEQRTTSCPRRINGTQRDPRCQGGKQALTSLNARDEKHSLT